LLQSPDFNVFILITTGQITTIYILRQRPAYQWLDGDAAADDTGRTRQSSSCAATSLTITMLQVDLLLAGIYQAGMNYKER
jgi:hypothetical protein